MSNEYPLPDIPASGNHWVNLDDLVAWKANYNDGDVGGIMQSIVQYGYNRSIARWQNNVIMAGNHTMLALKMAKREGYRPVNPDDVESDYDLKGDEFYTRNIVVDKHGKWFVQVSDCRHLPHIKAVAYAVADNEYARRAVRDEHMLLTHLREVADDAIKTGDDSTLLATGYDADEIKMLAETLASDKGRGNGDGGNGDGGNGDGGNGSKIIKVIVDETTFDLWTHVSAGYSRDELGDLLYQILIEFNGASE